MHCHRTADKTLRAGKARNVAVAVTSVRTRTAAREDRAGIGEYGSAAGDFARVSTECDGEPRNGAAMFRSGSRCGGASATRVAAASAAAAPSSTRSTEERAECGAGAGATGEIASTRTGSGSSRSGVASSSITIGVRCIVGGRPRGEALAPGSGGAAVGTGAGTDAVNGRVEVGGTWRGGRGRV